ncbi:thiol reductant ABC exporter subunit CydC [Desulfonatronum sp. SC1]|uniref:thiol reductant ABC exporter subunit CydC n=1 Tax=Desulfonatronum sp. SC1 TaxID=2109626 RepID=UPI000D30D59E|nr:thiol reductant ABC exporter subunit CydC [Desulfonatronum sp. SC1]PTN37065.1 thiol reductant ABC exporter subunit CydC [Desulfonatronum sp. SC1]
MRVFRLLLSMARAKWPWLLLGLACSVVTVLANMALLALAAWFLASMALAGVSGVLFNYFLPAGAIRTLAIVRSVGRYFERLVSHDATLRLLADLRVRFFERLVPLAPAGLNKEDGRGGMHSADLFSRLRADIDLLDNFYLRLLLPAGTAVCVVGVAFGFFWVFQPTLALGLAGLWLLAGAVLPAFCLSKGAADGAGQVEAAARLRCLVVDGLRGMEDLLVYGAGPRHRELVQRESDRLIRLQSRTSRLESMAQGMVGLASGLAMWLVLLVGIPLVGAGVWSPATLPMLAVLALVSFEAILPLPGAWRMWGQIRMAASRILEITEARPPVAEPAAPQEPRQVADLVIRDLWFTYPHGASDRREPTLCGVNLDLPQGARVGIVGSAGSGKTTLQHILLRFWEYDQGEVRLAGRELRTVSGEEVRARMAVVSQHVFLFNATIAENLRLGRPRATKAQLWEALRKARLEEFVASLPEGLDTQVGQFGARLSGGQARRLSVARALLKDAPILILDEPTEGLDPETEAALWTELRPLMQGRSVLLITHRPAGLEYMERVYRLEQGRLVSIHQNT